MNLANNPNWDPFWVDSRLVQPPRPMGLPEGIGDRLRAAAFAELQAIQGFRWAALQFREQASVELQNDWLRLALEEEKHLGWLIQRMKDRNVEIRERPVSDFLWRSFLTCQTAESFCHYMAGAEERGRDAGLRFARKMLAFDQESAQIFGRIAEEEKSHIELAYRYFPKGPEFASSRDFLRQAKVKMIATEVSPSESPIQLPSAPSPIGPKQSI